MQYLLYRLVQTSKTCWKNCSVRNLVVRLQSKFSSILG
jgi:hypothetical protein